MTRKLPPGDPLNAWARHGLSVLVCRGGKRQRSHCREALRTPKRAWRAAFLFAPAWTPSEPFAVPRDARCAVAPVVGASYLANGCDWWASATNAGIPTRGRGTREKLRARGSQLIRGALEEQIRNEVGNNDAFVVQT